jgi:hypothetical protein
MTKKGLVFFKKRRILGWIYLLEITKMFILPSIPFNLIFFDELISFLLGLPGLLASECAFE